jgi:hypothetical protein
LHDESNRTAFSGVALSRLKQIVLGGREIGPATLRNFFAGLLLAEERNYEELVKRKTQGAN